jgi:hypothetical protein
VKQLTICCWLVVLSACADETIEREKTGSLVTCDESKGQKERCQFSLDQDGGPPWAAPIDGGAIEPTDCPVVAMECPSHCSELLVAAIPAEGPPCLARNPVVIGCYDAALDRVLSDDCIRANDGTLFAGFSTTLGGPLKDTEYYARCSAIDRERAESARYCSDAGSD